MILHTYFRSSAAFRVRIALNLKGLHAEMAGVHLALGMQHQPEFRALNPQGLVPVLQAGDDVLTQSLAILEYLDEQYPSPPLLPKSPPGRARVRSLALAVACDIHPLNNLRVLQYLTGPLGLSDEQTQAWTRHWITQGFQALETMLADSHSTGRFCHGQTPTYADICLVPQVFNALRVACDLDPYPTIRRIFATCMALPAFADAAPERQPDAEAPTLPVVPAGEGETEERHA